MFKITGNGFFHFGVWLATCLVLGGAAFLLARDEPLIMGGVIALAWLSLIPLIATLTNGWKGQIIEIRSEIYEAAERKYAYIRQPNGNIIRLDSLENWQVGDHLEKKRGETLIQKVG